MPALHQIKLLPATIEQMKKMHAAKVPVQDIAEAFQVGRNTVRFHCGPTRKWTSMTPRLARVVSYLYAKRKWGKARFERNHLDWNMVRKALIANGVTIRPSRRPKP